MSSDPGANGGRSASANAKLKPSRRATGQRSSRWMTTSASPCGRDGKLRQRDRLAADQPLADKHGQRVQIQGPGLGRRERLMHVDRQPARARAVNGQPTEGLVDGLRDQRARQRGLFVTPGPVPEQVLRELQQRVRSGLRTRGQQLGLALPQVFEQRLHPRALVFAGGDDPVDARARARRRLGRVSVGPPARQRGPRVGDELRQSIQPLRMPEGRIRHQARDRPHERVTELAGRTPQRIGHQVQRPRGAARAGESGGHCGRERHLARSAYTRAWAIES